MKTGIFYGSTTGVTADIARRIATILGLNDADIHDVARTAPDSLADYDLIIAGSSTWGNGEIQDDWYDFLDGAQALDLHHRPESALLPALSPHSRYFSRRGVASHTAFFL